MVDKVHSLLCILNIQEPGTQISTELLAKKSPKTGVVQHIGALLLLQCSRPVKNWSLTGCMIYFLLSICWGQSRSGNFYQNFFRGQKFISQKNLGHLHFQYSKYTRNILGPGHLYLKETSFQYSKCTGKCSGARNLYPTKSQGTCIFNILNTPEIFWAPEIYIPKKLAFSIFWMHQKIFQGPEIYGVKNLPWNSPSAPQIPTKNESLAPILCGYPLTCL